MWITECKVCKSSMELGKAIKPSPLEENAIGPQGISNAETLEMIDVLKCPKCGHSEYINDLLLNFNFTRR